MKVDSTVLLTAVVLGILAFVFVMKDRAHQHLTVQVWDSGMSETSAEAVRSNDVMAGLQLAKGHHFAIGHNPMKIYKVGSSGSSEMVLKPHTRNMNIVRPAMNFPIHHPNHRPKHYDSDTKLAVPELSELPSYVKRTHMKSFNLHHMVTKSYEYVLGTGQTLHLKPRLVVVPNNVHGAISIGAPTMRVEFDCQISAVVEPGIESVTIQCPGPSALAGGNYGATQINDESISTAAISTQLLFRTDLTGGNQVFWNGHSGDSSHWWYLGTLSQDKSTGFFAHQQHEALDDCLDLDSIVVNTASNRRVDITVRPTNVNASERRILSVSFSPAAGAVPVYSTTLLA